MKKFSAFSTIYEEEKRLHKLKEKSMLITGDDHALDIVLGDLKKKMFNNIRHNKMGFVNGIAKMVRYKLDKAKQQKGKVALVPIK
jgi:hypothetical protein|tara:strand:+ start:308 stop:562 length:255 start_codon:yes stop_codon:yes gene_type:complete